MSAIQDWERISTSDSSAAVSPVRLLELPEQRSSAHVEPSTAETVRPSTGYTLRQFGRECCVALLILLLGLPLALSLPSWLMSAPEATVNAPASTSTPTLLVSGGAFAEPLGHSLVADGAGRFVAHQGNGFATGSDPLARSAPATAASSPFLDVVVQGGEADVAQPQGTVELATLHMIDRLRAQIDPSSSITVIGPIPQGEAGPDLLRVRDELAAATADKGVRFIDPILHGLRQGQPDLRQQLDTLLRRDAP